METQRKTDTGALRPSPRMKSFSLKSNINLWRSASNVCCSTPPRPNRGARKGGIAMYDEAADFSEHRTHIESMDATLAACGVFVDWPTATVCDVGGGGGLRAGLLASRAKRMHCADVIDQQARYGGEFVKLPAEKLARYGHHLPVD